MDGGVCDHSMFSLQGDFQHQLTERRVSAAASGGRPARQPRLRFGRFNEPWVRAAGFGRPASLACDLGALMSRGCERPKTEGGVVRDNAPYRQRACHRKYRMRVTAPTISWQPPHLACYHTAPRALDRSHMQSPGITRLLGAAVLPRVAAASAARHFIARWLGRHRLLFGKQLPSRPRPSSTFCISSDGL